MLDIKKKKKGWGAWQAVLFVFEEEEGWNHRLEKNWNGEGHLISVLGSGPS